MIIIYIPVDRAWFFLPTKHIECTITLMMVMHGSPQSLFSEQDQSLTNTGQLNTHCKAPARHCTCTYVRMNAVTRNEEGTAGMWNHFLSGCSFFPFVMKL